MIHFTPATVGFRLLSLFGLHTTLIIWEVVPFLILAIGVDNMFIISREFDRLRMEKQDEPLAHVSLSTSCICMTLMWYSCQALFQCKKGRSRSESQ